MRIECRQRGCYHQLHRAGDVLRPVAVVAKMNPVIPPMVLGQRGGLWGTMGMFSMAVRSPTMGQWITIGIGSGVGFAAVPARLATATEAQREVGVGSKRALFQRQ